ncbi:MAG: type 1 glutamine amidotransferase domain-containing protein [bacterium]
MARVAMIVGEGFEDSEFREPYDRLREAGHEVVVFGSKAGETVEGKQGDEKVEIEEKASSGAVGEFDALVLPGGHGPDVLRMDEAVVAMVRGFVDAQKPVAAVCHGPQLLIEAGVVEGRTMTSWPSVKTDLKNAGADWVDREVAEDGIFITSRKPDDLAAFSKAILGRLDGGQGGRR